MNIFAFQESFGKRCPRASGAGEDDYKHPSHALILIATDDARLKEVNDVQVPEGVDGSPVVPAFCGMGAPPVKDFDAFEENYGKVFFELACATRKVRMGCQESGSVSGTGSATPVFPGRGYRTRPDFCARRAGAP